MLPNITISHIRDILQEISEEISCEEGMYAAEKSLAALKDAIEKRAVYVPLDLWNPQWWKQTPFLLPQTSGLHRWFSIHVTQVNRTHVHADVACLMNHSLEPNFYNYVYTRENFLEVHGFGDPEVGDFIETGFYRECEPKSKRHPRAISAPATLVLITDEKGVTEALHIARVVND